MRLLPRNQDLGWTPYVWLLYLGFFFIQPIATRADWKEWLATSLAAIVFLALYFTSFWLTPRKRLYISGAIALLGFALAPFNSGSAVFIVYAAAGLGYAAESGFAAKALAVLIMLVGLETWALHLDPWFLIFGAGLSLAIGSVNIHLAQRNRANRRLRMAQEEIEHLARVAERERIARDLHDVLGHTLSVVILKSELASKLIEHDPERAGKEISEVEQISRQALAEVRQAIGGYRAVGLQEELAQAAATLKTAGVEVECEAARVSLSPAQETVLALAVREAVTNVMRHAQAQRCWLTLRQSDGGCVLQIRDDGRGGSQFEGNGIRGMRERVEALGGTLQRNNDGGTQLTITLPLAADTRSGAA